MVLGGAAGAVEAVVGPATTQVAIGAATPDVRMAGATHDENRALKHAAELLAPEPLDNVLVVEPMVEVARELLERTGREGGQDDSPRHRHPAHARRRAAEGVS
ncbi:MAG: hypothetical protein IT434_00210 [Phycisphaerales bacterium]|nr:hypothetical protein [Phycisphaerales bacterium]